MGFTVFKSIFLRKRSMSNAQGDFIVKNANLGMEICINWKSIT